MIEIHLYVINASHVLIPVVSNTESRFQLETAPVGNLERPKIQDLASALDRVIKRGNSKVPTPSRTEFPKPAVLELSGFGTWAELEKEATFYRVEWGNEHVTVSVPGIKSRPFYLGRELDGRELETSLEEQLAKYVLELGTERLF